MQNQTVISESIRIIAWLTLLIVLFYGLGAYPLIDVVEGITARIPAEMLQSGNWLIPHFNGAPSLETPPLAYWLTMLAYKVFGISEFSARLVSAVSALGLCYSLSVFLTKMKRDHSTWIAPFVMATSVGFILLSKLSGPDMLFLFLTSLSLFNFFYWHEFERQRYLYSFYLTLGLAVLAGGPLAVVMSLLVIHTFLMIDRTRLWLYLELYNSPAALLFLLIAAPWYLFVYKHHGDTAVLLQHWEHVFSPSASIVKAYPLWDLSQFALIFTFPWVLHFCLLARRGAPYGNAKMNKLMWTWIFVAISFFFLTKSKDPLTLYCAFPALVLLVGTRISEAMKDRSFDFYKIVSAALLLSAVGSLAYLIHVDNLPNSLQLLRPHISFSTEVGLYLLFTIFMILTLFVRKVREVPVLMLGLSMIPLTVLGLYTLNSHSEIYSTKGLIQHIPPQLLQRADGIYVYQNLDHGQDAVFYAKRQLPIIQDESLEKRLQNKHPFVLLTQNPQITTLEKFGLCVYKTSQRLSLMTNKCKTPQPNS